MKHIIKVNNILDAKDNHTRPLIAMDSNGVLFAEGKAPVPEGFVDLGLPSGTLWSTKNIGATNGDTAESWYGNYYAWGETKSKTNYIRDTYTFGASNTFSKYDSDGKTVLETVDDVATQTNSEWRMPTKEDFEELIAGTTNSWKTNYKGISGLNGRVFTSKVNGNMLFIPAAGSRNGSAIYNVGSNCFLWSSSLYLDYHYYACNLYFLSYNIYINFDPRFVGHGVRPIC